MWLNYQHMIHGFEPIRALCGSEARFRLVKALFERPTQAFHLRGLAAAARVDPSQVLKLLPKFIEAQLCDEVPDTPFRKYRAALRHPLAEALVATFQDGEREGEDKEPEIDLNDVPVLRSLLWTGRQRARIPAREAFKQYENQWRFVRETEMGQKEKQILERLKRAYGHGLING